MSFSLLNDTNDLNPIVQQRNNNDVPFGTAFESLLTTQANVVMLNGSTHSLYLYKHVLVLLLVLLLLVLLLPLLLLSIHTATILYIYSEYYTFLWRQSADMCVNSIWCECVLASANRFFFFQPYVNLLAYIVLFIPNLVRLTDTVRCFNWRMQSQ